MPSTSSAVSPLLVNALMSTILQRERKLIDGPLRRDFDPEMLVEVEILDVNEEEARALLLSIDPLAQLAVNQEQLHTRLLELTPVVSPDLRALWEVTAVAALDRPAPTSGRDRSAAFAPAFYVMIPCRDEKHQIELL